MQESRVNAGEPASVHAAADSRERLLAVLPPGKHAAQMVRRARGLAERMHCPWMVLYVESARAMPSGGNAPVTAALELARELGAEVITSTAEDAATGILRVAKQRSVTQIIVAATSGSGWRMGRGEKLLRRLLWDGGGMEIHAVPMGPEDTENAAGRGTTRNRTPAAQYFQALTAVVFVTLAAFLFTPVIGAHATALIFLLTVVVVALFVDRGPTLAAAALSAMLWDFFFLRPVFEFRITQFEDLMLFVMYFVVALVLGHLTSRIREQEEAERRREERATALYLLTRELNEASSADDLVRRAMARMESSFKAQAVVMLADSGGVLRTHPASVFVPAGNEGHVAEWMIEHRRSPGKFTGTLREGGALYVPLAAGAGALGVVGLKPADGSALTINQQNLLEAFAQQIALALERLRLNEISERAKVLAESEKLSKTLLDSMSHEIRTPIAAIQSATGNLLEGAGDGLPSFQREMVQEIQEATERLNRLVGNALEASRLDSGAVQPQVNDCDVADLVNVALKESEKQLAQHPVTVELAPGLPMVRMDFVLMEQALLNLLSNAAAHTPPGTAVTLSARLENGDLLLAVADRGPGIPSDSLPRVFDKFYRAPDAPTGGTGLGLSLVRGFVEAQGGRVRAENRPGGGAVFTISLPAPRAAQVHAPATL